MSALAWPAVAQGRLVTRVPGKARRRWARECQEPGSDAVVDSLALLPVLRDTLSDFLLERLARGGKPWFQYRTVGCGCWPWLTCAGAYAGVDIDRDGADMAHCAGVAAVSVRATHQSISASADGRRCRTRQLLRWMPHCTLHGATPHAETSRCTLRYAQDPAVMTHAAPAAR